MTHHSSREIHLSNSDDEVSLARRVLIVDDSPVIQKTTKRILMKNGYEVELASNGLLGLNMMMEKHYTFVLMGE
jgi:CheY-like chemotaxis protein